MATGHEIVLEQSDRHVRVSIGGELVADSTLPLFLHEGSLPVRTYLPREDIRMDLLEESPKRTTCPFKGEASYFSARGEPDVAWTYPDPLRAMERIRGLIAFYDERVES